MLRLNKFERHEAVRAGIKKIRQRDKIGWVDIANETKLYLGNVLDFVNGLGASEDTYKRLERYLNRKGFFVFHQ